MRTATILVAFISASCFKAQAEETQLFNANAFLANGYSEVVDLSSDSNPCSTPAPYPGAQSGTIGFFADGKPLVCGGDESTACYEYDVGADSWSESQYAFPEVKSLPAYAPMNDDQIWITGGEVNVNEPVASTWIFTPGEGFTPYVDLPQATSQHCLLRLNETAYFYIAGAGQNGESYFFDTETEVFTQTTSYPTGQVFGTGCGTASNGPEIGVIVVGGVHEDGTIIETVEIFVVAREFWFDQSGIESFPQTVAYPGIVQYENTFLIVGGVPTFTAEERYTDIYKYVPGNDNEPNTFEPLSQSLAQGISGQAAFFVPDNYFTCN